MLNCAWTSGNCRMQTEIFLIRHAQSHPRSAVHHSQWPLSELGTLQALSLAALLDPLEVEAVFSSPFRRCMDTIAPFASRRRVPVTVRENLRERLITTTFVSEGLKDIWTRSWEDFDYALPGCESSRVAQIRIATEVAEICRSQAGRRIAISSHGNVIGLLLNSLDGAFHRPHTEQLRNPDVLRLLYRDGTLRWDNGFRLAGLDLISTEHGATPVDRHEAGAPMAETGTSARVDAVEKKIFGRSLPNIDSK
jgi:2,3-bisphosphoglycerate-dependent phosphoglycerate mutase